ncbi:MAG TPA: hypothetical protein VHD36_03435 [Pirellulales bacterium]|nr:hypothetical protein [Pirellulales bacterium]
MELFAVSCTTCRARLKVRDPAAIGKILACPKCGSMVHVVAPAGWTPPSTDTINKIAAESTSGNTVSITRPVMPQGSAPAAASAAPSKPTRPTQSEPAKEPAAAPKTDAAASTTDKASAQRATNSKQPATAAATATQGAATVATPAPTVAATPPATSSAVGIAAAAAPEGPSFASRVLAAISEHRLVLLTAPVVLLVLALFAWILFPPNGESADNLASAPQITAAPAGDVQTPTGVPPATDVDRPRTPDGDTAPPTVADDGSQTPGSAAPGVLGDVAARRSEEAPPNLADLANDAADEGNPPQPIAEEPDIAAPDMPADDAPPVANRGKAPAAGPGNLTRPIVPFGAAPAGDALPPATADAAVPDAPEAQAPADDADGDMVVGHESMPPVDVAARLDDPLPAVQFKRIALADYCDFLSRLSTIPITLDIDALAIVNVRPGDQISVALEDTTVGDALTEVLAKRGLMFLVDGQQLVVTSPDRKAAKPSSVSYDVHDLAGQGGDDIAGVMTLVTRFVSPAGWQETGGPGRARIADGMLQIEQDPITQRNVALFLDKLRVARGLAPKETKPEDVTLKSKYARAKATLDQVMTANFSVETPLVEVLSWLGREKSTRVVIDEASLAQAGLWSHVPAKVVVEKQPLYEFLSALLSPLGMTYRIVGDRTVQVFARQSQGDRMEFEIYSLKDLLAARLDAAEIIERLRKQFDPASWTEGGGLGAMEFDEPSQSLLVVQTPEAQVRLENLLLRAKPGARPMP